MTDQTGEPIEAAQPGEAVSSSTPAAAASRAADPGPSAAASHHARRLGWAPPLAWDDTTIGDPDVEPASIRDGECRPPGRPDRGSATRPPQEPGSPSLVKMMGKAPHHPAFVEALEAYVAADKARDKARQAFERTDQAAQQREAELQAVYERLTGNARGQ